MRKYSKIVRVWLFSVLSLMGVSMLCQASATAGLPEALETIASGNYFDGIRMLKPLARKGNPDAQYLLGRAYAHGEGVDQNSDKAVRWLEKAADQMHYDAANTLGKMYASGMGVQISADLAAKWFERAADIADQGSGEHIDCGDY